ncbi:MAG: class I SAM-dependent methyltransferase [Clostridia bacterium]|nr:class I SAM-dependent methyltransferase [Clostridia bacterium]
MTSYQALAEIYDQLMDDVDRERWCGYLVSLLHERGVNGGRILDAACGTGEMTYRLLRAGFDVTGSDRSEEMLRIARERLRGSGKRCMLIRQDLTRIEMPGPVDAVSCACDGVNYLTDESAVRAFFEGAYNALKDGGVLLFDISSASKLRGMDGQFYAEDRGQIAYIWNNRMEGDLLKMDLTFFTERDDGLYVRMDETHTQRAHDENKLHGMLEDAGFTDVCVYGFQTERAPEQTDDRIQFAAVKKERRR